MRRPFTFFAAGVFALALVASGSLISSSPASAATIAPTTTCNNSVGGGGGQGAICEVNVTNTITAAGGTASVTVRECLGAAGAPEAACTNTTTILTSPVTAVNQCNDTVNGGGATLRCSVNVTNNFVGVSPGPAPVTVNQCVGSGTITTGCDPFPATTTGATITQCNGSATGGTLVQLTCTATGTSSPAAGILINQCNGSANGGGALVICSANVSNNISPAASSGAVAPTAAPVAPTAAPVAPTVAPVVKATPRTRSVPPPPATNTTN